MMSRVYPDRLLPGGSHINHDVSLSFSSWNCNSFCVQVFSLRSLKLNVILLFILINKVVVAVLK